jgi:hypothetical protein
MALPRLFGPANEEGVPLGDDTDGSNLRADSLEDDTEESLRVASGEIKLRKGRWLAEDRDDSPTPAPAA